METDLFQRMRGIRQMGFADQAFPGATHSRFSHGLGAMEVAGRLFDAIFGRKETSNGGVAASALSPIDYHRLRQAFRLAVLLHDVGHAPLSHATERRMPNRSELELPGADDVQPGRANHEDFTVWLIWSSSLRHTIEQTFGDLLSVEQLVFLISGQCSDCAAAFVVDGIDYGPLLRQLVSGELDADRLDYLQRDSFFAGVKYGKFDDLWLLNNLSYHIESDRAYLALAHRAIFAYEDFLLSRYHMFVSVYYHHTAVGLDTMLARYFDEAPDEFRFPNEPDQYVSFDDIALWSQLRCSTNRWAQRIVKRRLFRRLIELNSETDAFDLNQLEHQLREAGVGYFVSRDEGVLSRYYGSGEHHPIYVVNTSLDEVTPIESYSKLYERYRQPSALLRVYCEPSQHAQAKRCLKTVLAK